MSKYKIGLFGFGCVGQGLYETLAENDLDAEIVKICVKNRNKKRDVASDKICYDAQDILNDQEINVVVELIDDATIAFQLVKSALQQKKAVVSANKKMIAEHLDELIALQEEHQTPLLYDGAVCGSIPIIRNLEEYFASEQILEIKGIFNGSSNYILTKIFEEGKTYDVALADAQGNGFAESDPIMDVGGFDPKFKLSIVLQHAFGIRCHPDRIFNWGIQNISEYDISFAKERGLKIKLIAKAQYNGTTLSALVAPHFVDQYNTLYNIDNEFNCVQINGKFSNDQTLIGKGAGSLPTGLAVLSDVTALTKGYAYNYRSADFSTDKAELVEVYVSFKAGSDIDKAAFEAISEKFVGADFGYIIGKIQLSALQRLLEESEDSNVIFTSGNQMEMEIPKLTYSYAN